MLGLEFGHGGFCTILKRHLPFHGGDFPMHARRSVTLACPRPHSSLDFVQRPESAKRCQLFSLTQKASIWRLTC